MAELLAPAHRAQGAGGRGRDGGRDRHRLPAARRQRDDHRRGPALPRRARRGQGAVSPLRRVPRARWPRTPARGPSPSCCRGPAATAPAGVRAIHEAGGLVMAQSEESAKFDGMPRNAIDTGLVDLVQPPEELADALLRFLTHHSPLRASSSRPRPIAEGSLGRILALLQRECGIDFSEYKSSTVGRRIERRLLLSDSRDLERLPRAAGQGQRGAALAVQGPAHRRDPLLPGPGGVPAAARRGDARAGAAAAAAARSSGSGSPAAPPARRPTAWRCWSPTPTACWGGRRRSASSPPTCTGRRSTWPAPGATRPRRWPPCPRTCASGTSSARRRAFRSQQALRERVVFAHHNVIKDAPFTRLDLLTCRNLLIYFTPSAQRKAMSLFHFALKTGGVMVLGPSESPGALSEEFASVDNRWKIYRKYRDVRLAPADAGSTRVGQLDGSRGLGRARAPAKTCGCSKARELLLQAVPAPGRGGGRRGRDPEQLGRRRRAVRASGTGRPASTCSSCWRASFATPSRPLSSGPRRRRALVTLSAWACPGRTTNAPRCGWWSRGSTVAAGTATTAG